MSKEGGPWVLIMLLVVGLIVWGAIKDRGSTETVIVQPTPITESVEVASTTDEIITEATTRIIQHFESQAPLIPFAGCQEWSILAEAPPEFNLPSSFFIEALFPVCDGVIGEKYNKPISAYIQDEKIVSESHLQLRKLICDAAEFDTSGTLVDAGFTSDTCKFIYEEFYVTFGGFPPQGE